MNNKKRGFQIILITSLVIGWALGVFLFFKLNTERVQSQGHIDAAQEEIRNLQKSNEELVDKNKSVEEQNALLNTNLSETKDELESVIAEEEKCSENRDEVLDINRELSISLNNFRKRAECTKHWDFTFTSNSSMSSQLKKFVGENEGTAQDASWDVVWNNSSTAIHYVYTKDYLLAFLVSYEKDFSGVDSVLWVDNMCFISPE